MKNIHYAIMAAFVTLTYSVLLFVGTIPEVKGITLFSSSEETFFGLPKYLPITFSIPKIIDVACVFLSLFFLALIVRRIISLRRLIKEGEANEKTSYPVSEREYSSRANNVNGLLFLFGLLSALLASLFTGALFTETIEDNLGTIIIFAAAFGILVGFFGGAIGMEKSLENMEECNLEIFLTSSLLFIVLISINTNIFFGLTAGLILGAVTFILASIVSFIGYILHSIVSIFD